MYTIKTTTRFDKDVKLCQKRGLEMDLLKKAIKILEESGTLPPQYHPHKLSGNYEGCWEAHLKGDWLLVWQIFEKELTLILTNTGTHSDLFG
ncbi:MAG: type II toxin-antitoxin system YafQ family toxin [Bacteroidales bacterium]|nr:type II toxin-antitoxin system YafQ family toxin [Bacteroidales bacterium]